MKKTKIMQIALLGLTTGLLTNASVEAQPQVPSLYVEEARYLRAGCPNGCHGGCGGKKKPKKDIVKNAPKAR